MNSMNPFADPVAEAIFANKDVAGLAARSLINAVLSHGGDPLIGYITELTPQKVMSSPLTRGYRFDVEARVGNEEIADIEIQFRHMRMNERGLIYAGRFIDDNAKRGEKLSDVLKKMPRVIIINILHFDLRKDHTKFHQPVDLTYRIPTEPAIEKGKETKGGIIERATDILTIHNIELIKFTKSILPSLKLQPCYSNKTPSLHYWLWALCQAMEENKNVDEVVNLNTALKQFAQEDEGFRQYTDRYEIIKSDERVRREYNIWTEEMSAFEDIIARNNTLEALLAEKDAEREAEKEAFAAEIAKKDEMLAVIIAERDAILTELKASRGE